MDTPRAVRLGGHAQEMNMAGVGFDHEEDIDAAQGNCAVDVEEIACQHGRRMGAQKLPPSGPGALWRGWYPQPLQPAPHRGCPDPGPGAEQLALDPLIAPVRVLPRHLLDQ